MLYEHLCTLYNAHALPDAKVKREERSGNVNVKFILLRGRVINLSVQRELLKRVFFQAWNCGGVLCFIASILKGGGLQKTHCFPYKNRGHTAVGGQIFLFPMHFLHFFYFRTTKVAWEIAEGHFASYIFLRNRHIIALRRTGESGG